MNSTIVKSNATVERNFMMLNETDEFSGLADWQAATLYLGFVDDREPLDELLDTIKRNSEGSNSKESMEKWKTLHDAILRFDVRKIKEIGVSAGKSDLPWPKSLRKQGERYHFALRWLFGTPRVKSR